MHAYEIPNLRFSVLAGANVPRRRFVTVNASGEGVIASAGGYAIGVSMNDANTGEVLEVSDGIVIVETVETGEGVPAGAKVSVGAGGKAVTATEASEDTEATPVVGIALTGAGAGGTIAVKMV